METLAPDIRRTILEYPNTGRGNIRSDIGCRKQQIYEFRNRLEQLPDMKNVLAWAAGLLAAPGAVSYILDYLPASEFTDRLIRGARRMTLIQLGMYLALPGTLLTRCLVKVAQIKFSNSKRQDLIRDWMRSEGMKPDPNFDYLHKY